MGLNAPKRFVNLPREARVELFILVASKLCEDQSIHGVYFIGHRHGRQWRCAPDRRGSGRNLCHLTRKQSRGGPLQGSTLRFGLLEL